ncbi:hypothetical protein JR316_0007709 [Psilocybe cubensis]|uniref:F-box domain-containing protein n=2 Tax=Psilocybe cubensis TaxID=181762 RepID=A0A8H8CIM5_PSICU|nr:hypothetical protein JR316_0007709 [Psilocybe cubensis]KAH9479130.1 hypothetical protein JR316_0007709 [Psilocybe cubensis]
MASILPTNTRLSSDTLSPPEPTAQSVPDTLSLPPEVWLLVFPYLKPCDLRSISLTCSPFRYMAQPLLFSVLDVSPFFLAYNAEHPIPRPRAYLERFTERLKCYQIPHIAHGVRHCWVSPYSRTGFPARSQQDDLDPKLIINAIVDALPHFPNLSTLSWHCINISPQWWDIIQSLKISNLWLNSSSIPLSVTSPLPGIQHLDLDQWPWEGRVTNHVSIHEERAHGVDTVALQYVIQPDVIQYISVPRYDTACHLFSVLSKATYHLKSLKIPFSAASDPCFIDALEHCPSLASLCMFPPASDERSRGLRIGVLTPLTLPSLTSYEGPYSHVLQFALQPLQSINLWGFDERPCVCDPDGLSETLDDLADTATANSLTSMTLTVIRITSDLLETFGLFTRLEQVDIMSQDGPSSDLPIPHNLSAAVPVSTLYTMMNEMSLPRSIQRLRFSTRLNSSKLDILAQEHEVACFMEAFASRHPNIQRIEIGYGIYWTGMYSGVWGRIRENTEVNEAQKLQADSQPVKKGGDIDDGGGYSSKSSSKDYIVSTVVSTVHPLPLGKLTFTEHRRKILFPQDTVTAKGIERHEALATGDKRFWGYFWVPIKRLFGKIGI